MVYGSERSELTSVIEGNTVPGSRRSSGTVLGGGPAIIRNNVAIHHAEAGIALEDYRGRGLLRAVEVRSNTVCGNRGGGIVVRATRQIEATVAGNVVHARRGTPALVNQARRRDRTWTVVEARAMGDVRPRVIRSSAREGAHRDSAIGVVHPG